MLIVSFAHHHCSSCLIELASKWASEHAASQLWVSVLFWSSGLNYNVMVFCRFYYCVIAVRTSKTTIASSFVHTERDKDSTSNVPLSSLIVSMIHLNCTPFAYFLKQMREKKFIFTFFSTFILFLRWESWFFFIILSHVPLENRFFVSDHGSIV